VTARAIELPSDSTMAKVRLGVTVTCLYALVSLVSFSRSRDAAS